MNFGKRVKKARALKGLNQKELGDIVGLRQSMISEIEGSPVPNTNKIDEIASALGVTVEYLKNGVEKQIIDVRDIQGRVVDLSQFLWIPRYDIAASAGYGCDISEEHRIEPFPIPLDVAKKLNIINKADLIVMSAKGDSMIGEINNGDSILVDRSITDPSTGIYVIRLESDLLVKRIIRKPGGIIDVISTNPLYETFSIDMKEPPFDFSVIGKVLWSGSIK